MLECNSFAIQEHKKILSSVQSYEIKNGETGELVGTAREDIGVFTQGLRWVMSKHLLPTQSRGPRKAGRLARVHAPARVVHLSVADRSARRTR